MAFYDDSEDEEGQTTDPNQGAVQTGPGNGIIGGGGSNTPAAQGSPDKGGNFVGLQTYLDANKSQAGKLGDQTAGVVTSTADQARQGINDLNTQFNQQVDQNTIQKDEDATNLVGQTPEALNAAQKETLKRQYNAQYKGPDALNQLGGYQNTLQASNKANENLKSAATEEGRAQLINQINNKPRTQGITTFDNLLLQKGPGRDKLDNVVNQNKDLSDMLSKAEAAGAEKVGMFDDPSTPDVDESKGAKGTTAKTQAETYKTVQDALSGWKSGFDKRLAEAQDTGLQSRLTADIGGLGAGDPYLDSETFQALGQLNPHDSYYRLNLQDYLNPFNPGDVNASNVANAEDYARYGALADIAGIQDPTLRQEDIGKAGTAPKFGVDQQRLGSDLKAAKDAYTQGYQTTRGMANNVSPFGGNEGASPEFRNATIQELENYWLPQMRANGGRWGSEGVANIERNIANWKASQGANNKVMSVLDQLGNTSDGKIKAWI